MHVAVLAVFALATVVVAAVTPHRPTRAFSGTPIINCATRTICPAAAYYNRNESSEITRLNQHKLVLLNHVSQLTGPTAVLPGLDADTVVLFYHLFDFGVNSSLYDWTTVNSHEDWFLHSTNDNTSSGRIRYNDETNPSFNYWFMDLSNADYVNFKIAEYQNILAQYPQLDGFFLDISGAWASISLYAAPYLTCTSTGTCPAQITSQAAWDAAHLPAYAALDAALGSTYVVQNNVLDASYVPSVDGSMGEEFGHPGFNPDSYWYTEDVWRGQLDLVAGSQLISHLPWVFCGFNGGNAEQMLRFCTGFYLLGRRADTTTLFTFSDERDISNQGVYYSLYDLDLGQPTAAYARDYQNITGLYQRSYENGMVLVNPTAAQISVTLSGTFRDTDNNPVVGATSVPAHSALLLSSADLTAPAAVSDLLAT